MFSSQALGAPGPASPWFTRGQHQRWVWQEGVWRASQVLQWGRRAGGWSGRLLSPPGAPRFSCACGDFVRGRVMWGVLRSSHSCSVRANGRNRAGWAGAPPWHRCTSSRLVQGKESELLRGALSFADLQRIRVHWQGFLGGTLLAGLSGTWDQQSLPAPRMPFLFPPRWKSFLCTQALQAACKNFGMVFLTFQTVKTKLSFDY